MSLLDLVQHRRDLPHVAARGKHVCADDHLAGRVGAPLHVVGGSVAAVGHLHDRRLRIGAGGPCLVALGGLLLGLQFRQTCQRLLQTRGPFRGGTTPRRRLASAGRARVVVHFLLEQADLLLGLVQVFLQGGLAVERGGAGAGADAHAVLGDAVEIDQVLLAQHGHGLGQELIEEIDMAGAEVGQGVVVDGDATDEPAEGVVVGAQPGQGTGGADAL
jgi:hypothetical protein